MVTETSERPATEADDLLRTMRLEMADRPDLGPGELYHPPTADKFRTPLRELDFLPAPDLEIIASRLVRQCPELDYLSFLKVGYLWRREGGERKGHVTLGQCVKPSGLAKHFSGMSFIIWLAADHCIGMTREQVEAALYHELLHASPTGLIDHDVEMFCKEVTRYGLWRENLKLAGRAFGQLRLEMGA